MAYDAMRTIMPIAGWPEERLEVEISAGADRVLATRFRIAPRGCSERATDSRRGTAHPRILAAHRGQQVMPMV